MRHATPRLGAFLNSFKSFQNLLKPFSLFIIKATTIGGGKFFFYFILGVKFFRQVLFGGYWGYGVMVGLWGYGALGFLAYGGWGYGVMGLLWPPGNPLEAQPGGSPLEARPTSAPGWNLRVPGPQAQNQKTP